MTENIQPIPGHVDLRNRVRVAQWRERWFLQGGTHLFPAHPLQDLRNDADIARHMCIKFDVHQAKRYLISARRVTRLATIKYRKASALRAGNRR